MDDTSGRISQGSAPEQVDLVPGQVSPANAHVLITQSGYVYVDVRDADEYEEGRPAGAVNVPFSASATARFVEAIRSRFEADSKIVVGCNSGKRSALAVRALVDSGFSSVVECRTGWDGTRGIFGELREAGWKRVGLPTENGSPKRS
jgi:rhodanese-related sulfurtransferase